MVKQNILDDTIKKNAIVLISIPNCSYCVKAKEYLKKLKYKFKELLYTSKLDEEFWQKFKKKYPFVPRVIINKKFIGGFSELKDYDLKSISEEPVKKRTQTKKEEPVKKRTRTKKEKMS